MFTRGLCRRALSFGGWSWRTFERETLPRKRRWLLRCESYGQYRQVRRTDTAAIGNISRVGSAAMMGMRLGRIPARRFAAGLISERVVRIKMGEVVRK